jgi:hypothetical protein
MASFGWKVAGESSLHQQLNLQIDKSKFTKGFTPKPAPAF